MGTENFPCPKCLQLNTLNPTNQSTCKNCGTNLKQVLDGIEHIEKVSENRSTRIRDIIVLVAALGIIIAVAVPKAFSTIIVPSPIAVARGVGSSLKQIPQRR